MSGHDDCHDWSLRTVVRLHPSFSALLYCEIILSINANASECINYANWLKRYGVGRNGELGKVLGAVDVLTAIAAHA